MAIAQSVRGLFSTKTTGEGVSSDSRDTRHNPSGRSFGILAAIAGLALGSIGSAMAALPVVNAIFTTAGITTSVPAQNHTTILFTITSLAGDAATTVGFVETLPTSLRVAPTPNIANTCGGGTVTAAAGSTTITVANVPRPAGPATCTISVDVAPSNTVLNGVYNASCASFPAAFTTTPSRLSGLTNVTADPLINSCVTVGTWPALESPADRFGSALNCTANDVAIANVNVVGTTQCVFGQQVTLNLSTDITVGASGRYDIGIFIAQDGGNLLLPSTSPGGAASTSVITFPAAIPPVITNLDADTCFDGSSAGTLTNQALPVPITVTCTPNPTTGFLNLNSLITWDNTAGNNCGGAQDVVPNTKSKCNASTSATTVAVVGQINITKVTIPAADPTSFNFTAANTTVPANAPTPVNFSLTDGVTQLIQTAQLKQGGETYVITEQIDPGFQLTSIVCTNGAGQPVAGLTTNLLTGTVTTPMSTTNGIVNCTYTNTKKSTLTVNKTIVPASDPGLFNLTANTTTVNNQSNGGTTGAVDITAVAGAPVSESAGTGTSLGNYTTTYSCVDGQMNSITSGAGTSVPGGVTAAAGQSITCTFVNTRNPSIQVKKVLNPSAGDSGVFNLLVNGVAQATNVGNGGQTPILPAVAGVPITISETAGTGTTLANYTSSFVCDDAANTSGNGTSTTVTPTVAVPAVTCTFTNTRKVQPVTLSKILNPGADTGKFNLSINGSTVATDVGNGGSGGLMSIPVGSTVTIAEVAGLGTNIANYTSSVQCSSGVTAVSPFQSGTFTMPDAPVTCAFTNTRIQVPLTLQKTWVNAALGDSVIISAGTHLFPSTADLPNETDVDNPIFVDAGSTIALSEAFQAPAQQSSYASSLLCSGNPANLSNGVLTVNAGDPPVTCTFTNTLLVQPTLTKSFNPTSILDGGISVLTFTITNPPSGTTRIVTFTDTLPASLQLANGTVGGTCTGATVTDASNVALTAGSLSVKVINQTINAGQSCTITVNVTNKPGQFNTDCGANPPLFTNSSTNVSGLTNLDNLVQPSCLVVSTLPTLTKSFSPTTISVGGTTVLTFTVNNTQAGSLARNGLAYTDLLPSGLVLADGTVGGTCAGMTVTDNSNVALAAGSTSVKVTNLSIAQAASCTITVNVTNVPQQINLTCDGNPAAFTNASGSISVITGITNGVQPSCVVVNPLKPEMVKSFNPTSINVGGTTTLTFTVTNPAANPALSNISFVDTLPTGLQVANPAAVGGTCSNAAAATTAAAGSPTITVANLAVAAGASSCTVTVNVTNVPLSVNPDCAQLPAAFTNAAGNITGNTNVGTTNLVPSCVVVNPLVPSLNKAFNPLTINVGGTTTLTFTVTNPAAFNPAQPVSFVDTLPIGLQVAANPNIGGTCTGGTVTAAAGSGSITVAGKIVGASNAAPATCTITVDITNVPLSAGVCPAANFTNAAGNISGIVNITNNVTPSCVTVTQFTPSLVKSFSPTTFIVGGFTTLTFTITNPPADNPAQVVSFIDTLPAGLMVNGTPSIVNGCTGGTVTAVAGTNTISIAGVTVGASSAAPTSCSISVNVTNVVGQVNSSCTGNPPNFTNAAGNISGLDNLQNGVQPSCVTVTQQTPTLTKSFSPNTFVVGGFTTLTFTVTNPAANNPAQVVSFSDSLPAGLLVAGTPSIVNGCTGGTVTAVAGTGTISVAGVTVGASTAAPATCSISVNVTNAPGQVNPSCTGNPPNFTNAAGNISGIVNIINGVQPSCVTVTTLTPSLTKSFSPTTINLGGTTTLTFTVSNPANNPALNNVGFVDNLPSGLQIANPAAVGGTCSNAAAATTAVPAGTTITVTGLSVPAGASSCTVTVNVTNKAGQANPSCATNPAAFTNGPGNVTVTNVTNNVVNSCLVVNTFSFTITKTPSASIVTPGSPLTFTVVVTNNGPAPADGAIIADPVIPFYTANALSCPSTTGGATCPAPLTLQALQGAGMTVATFPAGSSITLVIDGTSTLASGSLVNTVTVSPPAGIPGVAQAVASAVVAAQVGVIPTLSTTTLIALLLLIGLAGAYAVRRANGRA